VDQRALASGFTDVDRAADPESYVRLLDRITTQRLVLKRQTFALLGAKEGARILDVGCGTGEDVRELAKLVGSTGRVIGVDSSEIMLREARARSEGLGLPIEYQLGDANQLPFADNTFDGCRAERILLHLEHPEQALREMCRVTCSSGAILVTEVDLETRIVDSPDRDLTRRILNYQCDTRFKQGWVGRRLLRLFKQASLMDIAIFPYTLMETNFARGTAGFDFPGAAAYAQAGGVVSAEEATTWLEQLQAADRAGCFFSAMSYFIASGQKP
jgi:ubiquinone/menaquinone biosynthesis C-methylase UbiE